MQSSDGQSDDGQSADRRSEERASRGGASRGGDSSGGEQRPTRLRVLRASEQTRELFCALHHEAHGLGWCQCVAWWVDGFDGWGERTRAENLALRERLFERGVFDGYFLVEDLLGSIREEVAGVADGAGAGLGSASGGTAPVAWAQVAPRDELGRIARVFERPPDPGAWAVTCLAVVPGKRRRGHARRLLSGILRDLPLRAATSLEAFPREEWAGESPDAGDLWNGPAGLYRTLGFEEVARVPPRIVMEFRIPPRPVGEK